MKKNIFCSVLFVFAAVFTANAQTPDSTKHLKIKPKINPTTMVEVKPETINHPSDTTQSQTKKISVNEEGVPAKKKKAKKNTDKKK